MRTRSAWVSSLIVALSVLGAEARAEAAIPSSVAVVEIEDARHGLTEEVRARLSTHLRAEVGRSGVTVIAVAGTGPALSAVATSALVTTVTFVGRRLVVVGEIRDLETRAIVAQARAELEVPAGRTPESVTRALLTDLVAQLRGELALGTVRPLPPPDGTPETPQEVEPDPPPYVPPPPPPDDPPPRTPDRHVLHAGLEAEAGTFAGVAELGLATATADAFYGGAQVASWRTEARTFVGGLAFAVRKNTVLDTFYGLGQLSLVGNEARDMIGLVQIAPRNDAGGFVGVGQIGLLNMAAAEDDSRDSSLTHVALGRVGLGNVTHDDTYLGLELGLGNLGGRAHAHSLAHVAVANIFPEGNVTTGAQLSAVSVVGEDFTGGVQVGLLASTIRTFSGLGQVGVVSYVGNNLYREVFGIHVDNGDNDHETFRGLVQAGAFSMVDHDFRGVLQTAGLATFVDHEAYAFAQVAPLNYVGKHFCGVTQIGALNLTDRFTGAFQVGVASYVDKELVGVQLGVADLSNRMKGAQVGVLNVAAVAKGVQVGVVNMTGRLEGLQIGLVNYAKEGGLLSVTPIANVGF
ncbi:MAG: hypothetical protein IPK71_20020 [Myxococcales bacterium]|nr:hypothetical protein [Myxococcales bacterium]